MKSKKIIGLILSLLMLITAGCGNDKKAALVNLKLEKNTDTVLLNGSYTLPAAKAIYDNNEEKTVSVTWDKAVDTTKTGDTLYTATYTENGTTVNALFKLTVTSPNKLVNISLNSSSATVEKGSTYILPKIAVAIYEDGTTATVNVTWDKAVNTTNVGISEYTAKYTENGIEVTAKFTLTVKAPAALTGLKLSIESAKRQQEKITTYKLPSTGTAVYEDGTTATVNVIWDKEADTTILGEKTYQASYTENGITKSTTFNLNVTTDIVINKVKKLEFNPATINVEKNVKVTLPATATAIYEDGTIKTVNVTWQQGTTVDTTTVGTKSNVAMYTEKYTEDNSTVQLTATYSVIVKDDKVVEKLTLATKMATVAVNGKYTLPVTATATYTNGTTATVNVIWDKIPDTTKAGVTSFVASYTEGQKTVNDYFVLTVTKSVAAFMVTPTEKTVNAGEIYALPVTGTIVYDDATTEVVNLTWDKTVNTTTAGTFIYTASCPSKTDKTAAFKLIVQSVVKGVIEIADATVVTTGNTADVIMTASNFSKTAVKSEITLNYDATALEFSSVTLLGDVATAVKTTTTGNGSVKLTITTSNATLLAGQIAKFTFKTLKSGDSQVKIGAANITDSTGAAYIETVITDIATVSVGIQPITNKVEIGDVKGSVNGEVEMKVSASGFTKKAMGIDVTLNFDTNYLDVARDSSGAIDGSIVTNLNSGFMGNLILVKEVSAGKIRVALITMNGSQVDLNGDIFKIKFKTKSTSGTTKVVIGGVEAADSINTYISDINSADSGEVIIEKGQTTDPTFEISDETASASGYVNVKIAGKNFKDTVGAVEFTLNYDAAYLKIEGEGDITFTNNLAGGMKIIQISEGKVIITGTVPANFMPNGDLVNVKFKANSKTGTTNISMAKVETAVASATATTVINATDKGVITLN